MQHNQAPHTVIADAHRQSIDIIAWHPMGHCVGTASHDGILKFWCREPPGSKIEEDVVKEFGDTPTVGYGPLKVGDPLIIPVAAGPALNALVAPPTTGGYGGGGGHMSFSRPNTDYSERSGGRGGGGGRGGRGGGRESRFGASSNAGPSGGGGGAGGGDKYGPGDGTPAWKRTRER